MQEDMLGGKVPFDTWNHERLPREVLNGQEADESIDLQTRAACYINRILVEMGVDGTVGVVMGYDVDGNRAAYFHFHFRKLETYFPSIVTWACIPDDETLIDHLASVAKVAGKPEQTTVARFVVRKAVEKSRALRIGFDVLKLVQSAK